MPHKLGKTPFDDVGHGPVSPQPDVLDDRGSEIQSNSFWVLLDDKFHEDGMYEVLVGD